MDGENNYVGRVEVVRTLPGTLLNSPLPGTKGNRLIVFSVSATPNPGRGRSHLGWQMRGTKQPAPN